MDFKQICVMKKRLILVFWAIYMIGTTGLYAQKCGYRFGAEIYGGIGVNEYSKSSAGVSVINGYQANPYLFVGIGLGYSYYNALISDIAVVTDGITNHEVYYESGHHPKAFFREKVNFLDGPVSPFTILDIGCPFHYNKKFFWGFYFEPAVGCDFRVGRAHSVSVMLGINCNRRKFTRSYWESSFEESEKNQVLAIQPTLHVGFLF